MVQLLTCSCRGPKFSFQNPCDSSQSSVSIPGDLTPSSGLHRFYTHVVHIHICRQTFNTHEIKNFLIKALSGPGEMVHWVVYSLLAVQARGLSSTPQHPCEKKNNRYGCLGRVRPENT